MLHCRHVDGSVPHYWHLGIEQNTHDVADTNANPSKQSVHIFTDVGQLVHDGVVHFMQVFENRP